MRLCECLCVLCDLLEIWSEGLMLCLCDLLSEGLMLCLCCVYVIYLAKELCVYVVFMLCLCDLLENWSEGVMMCLCDFRVGWVG